jgi:hypothetical protein
MITKTKAQTCAATHRHELEPPVGNWQTPPWTTEERLQRIQVMGQRIAGYIQFMCKVADLTGTSAEAKERAVQAFYEQMTIVDRQLGRIQEELSLG